MAMKFNKLKDPALDAAATPSKSDLVSKLDKVTAEIAKQDAIEKAAKKIKETKRSEFFRLADEWLTMDGLDRQVVALPEDFLDRFTVTDYVERYYPGWFVLEHTEDNKLILEQDPGAQPFSYVNNEAGVVLSRQVSNVGSGIDLDWLKEEWPEIAKRVTHEETITVFDDDQAVLYLSEEPASQGVFEQIAYLGKPQAKLAAPKKLKDDE